MNTAVYMLRCFQMGLKMADLEELNEGFVVDMMIESANDDYDYPRIATKEDFAKF